MHSIFTHHTVVPKISGWLEDAFSSFNLSSSLDAHLPRYLQPCACNKRANQYIIVLP